MKIKKTLSSMKEIHLEEIVKSEYRQYQLYTLMDRAIPYMVDGLKPSQRRILYTLYKNMNKGLLKVSSATGLVLSLHPHGPQSIESSIVNMAQDYVFANNYPLIDKKGYFGERMEPAPAASRYIECKLSKLAEFLLFDDLNQVEFIPNYDEKTTEPLFLLPKLPLMLLNGAEGIATGFSVSIPSFHHKDIIDSMINYILYDKAKKIKPWVHGYKRPIGYDKEKNRFSFDMQIEKINQNYYITELPRGYDSKKIINHLNQLIEKDFIKDFIDESAKNEIKIQLIFKKGFNPRLETVINEVNTISYMAPNYTIISDKGVKTFNNPEEIIEVFTQQRLEIITKRYQLLLSDAQKRITQNNEIIRFIKEKHYTIAEKKKDRKDFIDYLKKEKFTFYEYLSDMAIYRMTKEEVLKRELLVNEDKKLITEYSKVLKSKNNIKSKLIEELKDINEKLNSFLRNKEKQLM